MHPQNMLFLQMAGTGTTYPRGRASSINMPYGLHSGMFLQRRAEVLSHIEARPLSFNREAEGSIFPLTAVDDVAGAEQGIVPVIGDKPLDRIGQLACPIRSQDVIRHIIAIVTHD
jgi:hypothetical protein